MLSDHRKNENDSETSRSSSSHKRPRMQSLISFLLDGACVVMQEQCFKELAPLISQSRTRKGKKKREKRHRGRLKKRDRLLEGGGIIA